MFAETDELTLHFGTLKVARVTGPFFDMPIWFGDFTLELDATHPEAQHVKDYVATTQRLWTERGLANEGGGPVPDDGVLQAYADLLDSTAWSMTCGQQRMMLDGPSYFCADGLISWTQRQA